MFEDILDRQGISVAELSRKSGVGYNYVFKIVNNQTDFSRCGIGTARKLAKALNMDLNKIYAYHEEYFENKIYYENQDGWTEKDFGLLNAEMNKLLLIAIDYKFAPEFSARSIETNKVIDKEIKRISFKHLSEKTKCIMVAILNQQKVLTDFVKVYPNLKGLLKQKPLSEKLRLSEDPYNIFKSYREMNIEY